MKYVTAFPERPSLKLCYSRVRGDGLKTVAILKKREELNLGHLKRVVKDRAVVSWYAGDVKTRSDIWLAHIKILTDVG